MRISRSEQSQDIDASPFIAADNFTFNDVENFSQEIRLTSDESFRLPWIVGANYAKTDIDWFQTIDLTAARGYSDQQRRRAEHRGLGACSGS